MKHSGVLAILLLLFITSCTVYKDYQIDVYRPGIIAVQPDVQNVAIVYRNFKYSNDTLQHFYQDDFRLKQAKNDPKDLDSTLVNLTLQELAKDLKDNHVFSEIRIFPELFKLHRGDKLPVLDLQMVQKISETANADLLISLETYSYFYSEYTQTDQSSSPSNEVITAAAWAVYDPVESKLLERKTMIDTVFWNSYDNQGNYQRNAQIPPRITALKIASQMAGENYAKRFFASWQTVNRMYSIPPLPDFDAADQYVQKGEWDNAILLWRRYTDEDNGKMAINARYNLALAYEMKDDLDTAEKWLIAAQQLATSYRSKEDLKMIILYRNIIAKRKNEIARLNQEG